MLLFVFMFYIKASYYKKKRDLNRKERDQKDGITSTSSFTNAICENNFNDKTSQSTNVNIPTTNILEDSQTFQSEPLDLSCHNRAKRSQPIQSQPFSFSSHYNLETTYNYYSQGQSYYTYPDNPSTSHSIGNSTSYSMYSTINHESRNIPDFRIGNNNSTINILTCSNTLIHLNTLNQQGNRSQLHIETTKKNGIQTKIMQDPILQFNSIAMRCLSIARKELNLQLICKLDKNKTHSIVYFSNKNISFSTKIYRRSSNESNYRNSTIGEGSNPPYRNVYLELKRESKIILYNLTKAYCNQLKNRDYPLAFKTLAKIINVKFDYLNSMIVLFWKIINSNCGTTFNINTNFKNAVEFLKCKEVYNQEVKNLLFMIYKMKLEKFHYFGVSQIFEMEKSKLKYMRDPRKEEIILQITIAIREQIVKNLNVLNCLINDYKDYFDGDLKDYIYEDLATIESGIASAVKVYRDIKNK